MGQVLKFCTRCENQRGCDLCADLHEWIMERLDAVPVVRCRECKYSRINHLMKKDILSCENIDVCGEEYLFERNPNDFCSYGERKEGAE